MPRPASSDPGNDPPSGDHAILICGQPMQWQRLAIPFLREGLSAGERVVCLSGLYSEEQIQTALRLEQLACLLPAAWERLSIWPVDQLLLPYGIFDPETACARLLEVVAGGQRVGLGRVRLLLDMNWGSYLSLGASQLLECERMLDEVFLPRCPCKILCHYEKVLFAPHILEVLASHHRVVLGEALMEAGSLVLEPPRGWSSLKDGGVEAPLLRMEH